MAAVLAWAGPASAGVLPAKPQQPPLIMVGWIHNQTNRTLTLKAEHLDSGGWNKHPDPQVPPGGLGTWQTGGGNAGLTAGYVTYTINNTGGQGYAYMYWHIPHGPASFDAKAGGPFTIAIQLDDKVHYVLRCLNPRC